MKEVEEFIIPIMIISITLSVGGLGILAANFPDFIRAIVSPEIYTIMQVIK